MSTKTKKQNRFYDSYVPRSLRSQRPKNGITGNARQQLNSVLCHLTERLSIRSQELATMSGRRTISEHEVLNAMRLCCPASLNVEIIGNVQSTLDRFDKSVKSKGIARHIRAGLVYPPSVAEKYLRSFNTTRLMVTQLAPISLCAIIETISSLLLCGAADMATSKNKVRVTVRDLYLTMKNNEGLKELFKKNSIAFVGGGVVPFLHPTLRKKKKTKKKRRDNENPITRHRYKPGTVAIRDIKKFQKISNCLILAKAPFEKLIRGILNSAGCEATKVSKQVFVVLQYYLEARLIEILSQANLAALHAGRIKVLPDDIDFVVSLQRKEVSFGVKQLEQEMEMAPEPAFTEVVEES